MKILAVHSAYNPDQDKRSAVDAWRLARPMRELRKLCPDWQIDERHTVIPGIEEYKDSKEFTESEMQKAFENICSYDIVISTYQSNPMIYSLLKVAEEQAGTQYIMDVDDDMFHVNEDNPVWLAVEHENIFHMQLMIRDNKYLSTTTEALADVFRQRREHEAESVFVNPNYITDDYRHPKFDNGDKLVIGFFGGSSHYGDLHRTGVLEAIEKIMHEYKHVHFKSVGMPIDHYLPKARFSLGDAKKGDAWLDTIYPSLNMDIAIAPLEDNLFNKAKSNIKWQEATRAGSLFIASDVGAYSILPKGTAVTVPNTTEAWYQALKKAVIHADFRKRTVLKAQTVLEARYRLEDNIEQYKDMFESVYAQSKKLVKV